MKHKLKRDDIVRIYNETLAQVKAARADSQFPPTGQPLLEEVFQATRTHVHEALHLELPTPLADEIDDVDDVHHFQKKHGKALWKEADRLIAEAGYTARGGAS